MRAPRRGSRARWQPLLGSGLGWPHTWAKIFLRTSLMGEEKDSLSPNSVRIQAKRDAPLSITYQYANLEP